jgi:hypothetical protein
MSKNKYIVVKNRLTHRVVERINCNDKYYNNFQIGYEAGKLVGKYPEDVFMVYLEESKLKY